MIRLSSHVDLILLCQVTDGPAHCLAVHAEGFLVCVGGDSGEVAMVQLSSGLVEVTKVRQLFFIDIDFDLIVSL